MKGIIYAVIIYFKVFSLCLFIISIDKPQAHASEIEISGLIIDRTLTRFGKDFTFFYASYWRELTFTQGYNATLYETVYPQAGTVLWLEINDVEIYRTHFGRRSSPIKQNAEQAILKTIDYLAAQKAMESTHDLQPLAQ